MNAVVKSPLSWAISALQVTQTGLQSSPLVKRICQTIDNSLHVVPLGQENAKPEITRVEVMNHCSFESCWIIVNNKVYDVTKFLRIHPGGDDIIMEHAGCDATSVFIDKGHSQDAYEMLAEYFIGNVSSADLLPEK